ncbi:MAG: glycosyltransferase family 9 protein [Candidatus Omnitrophota bacterium]|jgi:heptosyltransferase-2
MRIKADKKVLIVKLGYSETLDSALSLTTSLGDVLRSTVILHFFKGYHVSWLADRQAFPLLEGNKHINRILAYDPDILSELKKDRFDTVVNLEKIPEICEFSGSLVFNEYFGFYLNGSGNLHKYALGSKRLLELAQDIKKKRENKNCWQEILAEALDKKWNYEEYLLGYRPNSKVKYDIGFNWSTGYKWSNKAWPRYCWEGLESLLKDRYAISWQEGLGDIREYMDWIDSCRMIITADTLGLHLALALKKKVIALFGPTSHREIYFYNRGSFLLPEAPYKCTPCLRPYCEKKRQCMEYIFPERVKEKVEYEFTRNTSSRKV